MQNERIEWPNSRAECIKHLRHPNGRGLLLDDAEANRGAYIDKTSHASGFAKLRDCRLEIVSKAEDECQIYGGIYRCSVIRGKTICAGAPLVVNSVLDCSEISGRPTIYNALLSGVTEVCDSPVINGPLFHDAIIYGSPTITGTFVVTGRVHEGTWTRAPKHIKLPWCDLSECIDGKMLLNCYCRPVVWWLRFGPRIAKKWNWSQDMIDVTLETIRREFLCVKELQKILDQEGLTDYQQYVYLKPM